MSISTRQSFGQTLVKLGQEFPEMVVLDAEMSNSTFTNYFAKEFPERFFQNFIAEQNMISTALGLNLAGKLPVCATFAAFLTRAFDQIRLAQYSFPKTNLKIAGSHCGISIGTDGPSQMALEDLSLFGSILHSIILYPSSGIATEKLTKLMLRHHGISYIRLTRDETEEIYTEKDDFQIGGSKTLKTSQNDEITLIGAGITIFECLKVAQNWQSKKLEKQENQNSENINSNAISNTDSNAISNDLNPNNSQNLPNIRVIDLYSVKPFDEQTILKAARETKAIIVVEDHFEFGGIFSNLSAFLAKRSSQSFHQNWQGIHSLSVQNLPKSGSKTDLLAWAKIDSTAIENKINEILNNELLD